ncbi:hypothetical protein [Chitinimonas sp. BJB300]|uniref:hypothetical protein n=1 Tax=Chitinimonas sp. BJB300 TaxID=1559339 RepID=UPI000C11241C|nr:hypothetical protein [Chitinimonas sp. BJB300]PHV11058.1 hypothetical protein CSQ89_13000 [Chitinimonas sp. BJB300]TSJ90086.1 hypothetical protein FG002_007830 [Chitinimonas sp. BJB300]
MKCNQMHLALLASSAAKGIAAMPAWTDAADELRAELKVQRAHLKASAMLQRANPPPPYPL